MPIERIVPGEGRRFPFEISSHVAFGQALLLAVAAWAVGRLLLTAWVGDDAYITFRTVDNAVRGYGLRWNSYERVQAYTNPLWLFLHIPVYFVWRNIFLVTMLLSFLCTVASIIAPIRTFNKPDILAALLWITPLICSRTWREFAMSGLENPLSYLLFTLFGWFLLRREGWYLCFWRSVLVALAMLNRLDTGLIYAPCLLYLGLTQRKSLRWRQIAAGFMPLLLWCAFSLFYYGFLFPNTKYAKLDTGIAWGEYVQRGLWYIADFALSDMPGTAIVAAGLFCTAYHIRAYRVARQDWHGLFAAVGLGVVLYIFYILAIGGDFMSGRFFSSDLYALRLIA